jgi:hypothetical protein
MEIVYTILIENRKIKYHFGDLGAEKKKILK